MKFEESSNMEDYKNVLYQIFNYAKALNELRNPIVVNIKNYQWNI